MMEEEEEDGVGRRKEGREDETRYEDAAWDGKGTRGEEGNEEERMVEGRRSPGRNVRREKGSVRKGEKS